MNRTRGERRALATASKLHGGLEFRVYAVRAELCVASRLKAELQACAGPQDVPDVSGGADGFTIYPLQPGVSKLLL